MSQRAQRPIRKCKKCGILKLPSAFREGRRVCRQCTSRRENERKKAKLDRTVLPKGLFEEKLTKTEKAKRTLQAYKLAERRLREIHREEFLSFLDEERMKLELPPSNRRYTSGR